MRRPRKSFDVALCGVSAALGIVCLLIASLFPILGIIMPCIAGLLVLLVCVECGLRMALALYGSIALLGAFLVPDKEVLLLFVVLLGYYPLLKAKIEHIRPKGFVVLCKFLLLNIAIASNIVVFYLLFPVVVNSQEAASFGILIFIACYAMCLFSFFVYDKTLPTVLRLYYNKWRKWFKR